MPSKTAGELVESINELHDRIEALNTQVHRLAGLRTDLKAAADQLSAAGGEVQSVTSALLENAKAIQGVNLAAVVSRLDKIESGVGNRAQELLAKINSEMGALSSTIKQGNDGVSKECATLASMLEKMVADTRSDITAMVKQCDLANEKRSRSIRNVAILAVVMSAIAAVAAVVSVLM